LTEIFNKIYKIEVNKKILEALDFLALLSFFVVLVLTVTQLIASTYGYMMKINIMLRLSVFFGSIIGFLLYRYTKPYGMLKLLNGRDFLLVVSSSIVILLSLVALFKNGEVISISIVKNLFVIYLLVATYNFWSILFKTNLLKNTKLIKILIGFLVILSLGLPILTPKYLNSESYPNQENTRVILNSLNIERGLKTSWQTYNFNQTFAEKINKNVKILIGNYHTLNIGHYQIEEQVNGLDFSFNINVDNLSALCLLLDSDYKQDSIYSCIDNLSTVKKISGMDDSLIKKIYQYKFVDDYNFKSFISSKNNADFEKRKWLGIHEIEPLLAISLVRGAVFHHYNAVLLTINSASSPLDYFSNQYGFGPLFFVNTISHYFKTTIFDSLYLTIPIFTLITFFLLLVLMHKDNTRNIVFFGFSLSVLVTYGVSGIYAPFLYFIRYFPAVLLAFYLFRRASLILNASSKFESKSSQLLFFILVIVGAVYSFEYGLLTSICVLVVSSIYKNKFYFISGLSGFATTLLIKVYTIKPIFLPGSLLASLTGTGMDGSMGAIAYLYLVSLFSLSYLLFRIFKQENVPKELFLLFLIVLLFSFKVLWQGSGNHVGPLFLFMALIVAIISKSNFKAVSGYYEFFRFHYLISTLILSISIFNIAYYSGPNSKHDAVNYADSNFTKLFNVDLNVVNKIKNFESIFNTGDFLLSQNDDLLSVATGKLLTKPFQNVSTNNNYKVDESLIYQHLLESRRVVVDKSILSDTEIKLVGKNFIGINALTDSYIFGFLFDKSKFLRLYIKLIEDGFVQNNENDNFIVLIRSK
jgi:hypothetical protein